MFASGSTMPEDIEDCILISGSGMEPNLPSLTKTKPTNLQLILCRLELPILIRPLALIPKQL